MAKQRETFSKIEVENNKRKRKLEKEQKKQERKANSKSGKSLDDMIAYVDEYGNITSTPPDPARKKVIKEEDIVIGSRNLGGNDEKVDTVRTGTVTFFNDSKGYGFIKDLSTQESVFVHVNGLVDRIKERDKVTFEVTMTPKGTSAIKVKIAR